MISDEEAQEKLDETTNMLNMIRVNCFRWKG